MEIDPQRSSEYSGQVDILLMLERSVDSIVLHAADLKVSHASVSSRPDGGDDAPKVRTKLVEHPQRETIELQLPERLPAGTARLSLRFRGKLRNDLKGLYSARSGAHSYAFTQLEAADARRFFPCFDEPSFKARFELSVVTASEHAVVSNAPIAREQTLEDQRKLVTFAATPPLSTYLIALAVGQLTASKPVRCGKTPIRVWHVPGDEGMTKFALETAQACLERLERYFGTSYPYEKLDLVAVPDFEIGAMENAGAVFFRETLLLVNPRLASLPEQKRAAEVICHELAHMWYGNLVTMAWWDDLWLNEAFATWMAFHIVDEWKPEWKMWHDYAHARSAALQADALRNTHSIYSRVRTPSEATENFDVITYEKGAAVVRMLERYLGPRVFRSGVRAYIRKHRESNTVARDLWQALSHASGQDVEAMIRAWIEQPGFPLVAISRHSHQGVEQLELAQIPFRLLNDGRAARTSSSGPGVVRWPVPWVGHVGKARGRQTLLRHLLHEGKTRIPLPKGASFVYGNADEGGFFRPLHSPDELARLCRALDSLKPIERLGLVTHQWAMVQGGYAPLASLLDVVQAHAHETDPDVLTALASPLEMLVERIAPYAEEGVTARTRQWLGMTFRRQLTDLGWGRRRGESDEQSLRRNTVISLLGLIAEVPEVMNEADARCERYLDDASSIDANLANTVITMGARLGDVHRYDRFLELSQQAQTPQERRRFRIALGDFRSRALIDRTLALCLTEAIPTQDVVFVLVRLLANRDAREPTWGFIKRRWTRLQKRMPGMLVGRVVDATTWLDARRYKPDVAAFFEAHPVPTAARSLRQTMERFDLYARMQRRDAPELGRWLAAHDH